MKLTTNIDKIGTAGLFVTALFSPCCFPLFAFAASALGLGSFELFGGRAMLVFQILVLIAVAGLILSYFKHRSPYPLLIAVPGALSIFGGYLLYEGDHWIWFLYAGMFALLAATILNYRRNKKYGACNTCTVDGENVELSSVIVCPNCGHKKEETMPADACVYFYECTHCKTRLKPLPGDCCVFCSYGTVKCPPVQAGERC